MKKILTILCCIATMTYGYSQQWTTFFAYNQVTQIAMSPERIYAISDGSLYSVDKISEQIRIYNSQSGLHSTGISCIQYDDARNQLIIAYQSGKIDLLTSSGVQYISDLYDKDMTQRKTVNNITISGYTAYLSTAYGVQTMNLKQNKLVDSYWLRPNGEETDIRDVVLFGDSIYAFTTDSLFCAKLSDNIVDYRYWKRELRSGRIAPDSDKGVHYNDGTSDWYAGGGEGIVRVSATERQSYKPEGPKTNTPYSLTAAKGQVWMVPGGRWAVQYFKPGIVMHYNGHSWVNVETSYIESRTGIQALDFMNTAVDPRDPSHYFVTSYGTGLYEFRADSLVKHYLPAEDNTIVAVIPSNPTLYTRLDCAVYDEDNHLWFFTTGSDKQLQCLDSNGQWHAITVRTSGGTSFEIPTPTGLLIDSRNANRKWFSIGRYAVGLTLLDDGGTRWDETDDMTYTRSSWVDQHGKAFEVQAIYGIAQDALGRIWIVSEQGAAYIDSQTDFITSNAIVRPNFEDNNGENPITSLKMNAIAVDPSGQIWLGTNELGVYVLDSASTEIKAHYTTENSALPSNSILSLAADEQGVVWIGSSEGLVRFDPNGSEEGLKGNIADEEDHLDPGSMQQWRLHLSYNNTTEVVGTEQHIFAIANGALFSFNRADEAIEYWDQSKGLNGTTITHICRDKASGSLVIVYSDGRIDLMDTDGTVRQMPDISVKAGAVSVSVNSARSGDKNTYLAMQFGIVAINCKRGEVKDTYYIGHEAADVDVLAVLEKGDSIYAFSSDSMYSGCMRENLADYHFWHANPIPLRDLTHAEQVHNQIYTVQHDSLYRYENGAWQLVDGKQISWIHATDGKLLVCSEERYLYELNEEGELTGLCDRYYINDAIYSKGEYWLGEKNWGLIRLGTSGDEFYHTEGPNTNSAYYVHTAHGHVYAVNGGRWATEYIRPARINVYDGTSWRGVTEYELSVNLGRWIIDPVSVAVDNQDPGHYYVAAYGCGVIEFRNFEPVKQYNSENSTLRPVNSTINPEFYTRTDGAMMDKEGNLWVMNATTIGKPLHVLPKKTGQWVGLSMRSESTDIVFNTPAGIWPDRRDSRYKWMMDQRADVRGVIFHFDNGTPTSAYDDQCIRRNTFVDQNNNILTPNYFYSLAQDKNNRVWIGTDKGILIIPSDVDFFQSNACRRIIIPRNDGTGLGDYLLGEEQIQCLLADEGNRMWIGTAGSGLYLIEDDTITVAHFTESNSLLPSNNVLSLTIVPETGELFVGTEKGIASYRSDANEAKEDMSGAYAYPNPVRPDYGGMITIAGLMDNSEVRIVDSGGGLVCRTRSHGGTAVWDGKLPDGRRATPGVYTALCNAVGGHTAVKILVIR